ncbi:MAG: redoxin family protein [Methylotenera sp.]|nr:redoxin family protein [Oligoflexia bacterium]
MVWKPKEKEATLEESIAAAVKEYTPFWFGSTPLLCGVRSGEKVQAQPLNPSIIQGMWMIFFGDMTDSTGETGLFYLHEFKRRYEHLGVHFIWVVQPRYAFQSQPRVLETFTRKNAIDFPFVLDAKGLLAQAFGRQVNPKFVVIHDGKLVHNSEGPDWMKDTEALLHEFLRTSDPGLPLLSVFKTDRRFKKEISFVEFGKDRGSKIQLQGKWDQDADRIFTTDPTASMSFQCLGPNLSVFAQSLSRDQDVAILQFEVAGSSIDDSQFGPDLERDDEGRKIIRAGAGNPDLYDALIQLPGNQRMVTLRTPLAKRAGVALFGLRMNEFVK